jgi:uncharacterized protein (TIGR00299 family) protein
MTAAGTVVWFNPAVGVAGDMVLGALVDLGASEDVVRDQLARLGLDGWTLSVSSTRRGGLTARSVEVGCAPDQPHRRWSDLDALLAGADLHPSVERGARRTFAVLAGAEAAVHGIDVDAVHFHEVGALDALVDVVGSWAALVDVAGEDPTVHTAPVGLGTGTAPMAHGRVPVPAPAVLELLRGHPVVPVEDAGESATPTGVALLVSMARRWGPVPAGVVDRVGRGAGRRDPSTHPNVLTAVLVDTDPHDAGGAAIERRALLETNVDDVTPETLGHVVARALEAGADDAWVTPIVMKKGRPAHLLSVLCDPRLVTPLRHLVAAETGTLGIRVREVDRYAEARTEVTVQVDGHAVRVKVGPHGAKPEHDDVAAAAAATGRPLHDVAAAALAAQRQATGGTLVGP